MTAGVVGMVGVVGVVGVVSSPEPPSPLPASVVGAAAVVAAAVVRLTSSPVPLLPASVLSSAAAVVAAVAVLVAAVVSGSSLEPPSPLPASVRGSAAVVTVAVLVGGGQTVDVAEMPHEIGQMAATSGAMQLSCAQKSGSPTATVVICVADAAVLVPLPAVGVDPAVAVIAGSEEVVGPAGPTLAVAVVVMTGADDRDEVPRTSDVVLPTVDLRVADGAAVVGGLDAGASVSEAGVGAGAGVGGGVGGRDAGGGGGWGVATTVASGIGSDAVALGCGRVVATVVDCSMVVAMPTARMYSPVPSFRIK